MVLHLPIFSFFDPGFFCWSECIHVLTWECVYRSLLINVESFTTTVYSNVTYVVYMQSLSYFFVLWSYNVHHAYDLSSSTSPSQFFSHAVLVGSVLTVTAIIWFKCSCVSFSPALIFLRMFQHTRLYII